MTDDERALGQWTQHNIEMDISSLRGSADPRVRALVTAYEMERMAAGVARAVAGYERERAAKAERRTRVWRRAARKHHAQTSRLSQMLTAERRGANNMAEWLHQTTRDYLATIAWSRAWKRCAKELFAALKAEATKAQCAFNLAGMWQAQCEAAEQRVRALEADVARGQPE